MKPETLLILLTMVASFVTVVMRLAWLDRQSRIKLWDDECASILLKRKFWQLCCSDEPVPDDQLGDLIKATRVVMERLELPDGYLSDRRAGLIADQLSHAIKLEVAKMHGGWFTHVDVKYIAQRAGFDPQDFADMQRSVIANDLILIKREGLEGVLKKLQEPQSPVVSRSFRKMSKNTLLRPVEIAQVSTQGLYSAPDEEASNVVQVNAGQ